MIYLFAFFEYDEECDEDKWEAYGQFGPSDVHRQFAIVFRTPPYYDTNIAKPKHVKVQLKRVSDGETSEPKDFIYYPKQLDQDEIQRKRKKTLPFSTVQQATNFPHPGGFDLNFMTRGFPTPSNIPYPPLPPYQPPAQPWQFQHQGPRIEFDGVSSEDEEAEDGETGGSSSSSSSSGDSDSDTTDSDTTCQSEEVDETDGTADTTELSDRLHSLNINEKQEKKEKKHSKKDKKVSKCAAMAMSEHRYRCLHDYAKTGNVKHLLSGQHNLIGISDKQGDTALHLAVIHTQTYVIDNLLATLRRAPDQDTLINARNKLQQTALHVAAVTGQTYAVCALRRYGADLTMTDRNGNTALHLAATHNRHDVLQALVQDRPNHAPELSILNYDGFAPLHLAVLGGDLQMVQTLLLASADVNIPDGCSGRTALHLAVENDNEAMATYMILEYHAQVDAQAFDGNTALHIAVGRNLAHMASFLISMGANSSVGNYQGADSDDEHSEQTGHSAHELAQTDEMLSILSGEKCRSLVPESFNTPEQQMSVSPVSSDREDFGSDIRYTNDSGISLSELNHNIRNKLATILDPVSPGNDWIALATWLSRSSAHISQLREEDSPTVVLLHTLEKEDCTLTDLKCSFSRMNNTHAIDIITQFQTTREAVAIHHKLDDYDDENQESGLGPSIGESITPSTSLQNSNQS